MSHTGSLPLNGQEDLFFPAGVSIAFPPVNCLSQPGGTAVPGDLSSGAVPQSCGKAQRPKSQGTAKPHGHVYVL